MPAMIGSTTPATFATRLTPPNSTGAARIMRKTAVQPGETACPLSRASLIVLACTMLNAKPNAKISRIANTIPQRREPRPRWM
ncbi:hypothetical protein D3C74_338590 [compost metagenome]